MYVCIKLSTGTRTEPLGTIVSTFTYFKKSFRKSVKVFSKLCFTSFFFNL